MKYVEKDNQDGTFTPTFVHSGNDKPFGYVTRKARYRREGATVSITTLPYAEPKITLYQILKLPRISWRELHAIPHHLLLDIEGPNYRREFLSNTLINFDPELSYRQYYAQKWGDYLYVEYPLSTFYAFLEPDNYWYLEQKYE